MTKFTQMFEATTAREAKSDSHKYQPGVTKCSALSLLLSNERTYEFLP